MIFPPVTVRINSARRRYPVLVGDEQVGLYADHGIAVRIRDAVEKSLPIIARQFEAEIASLKGKLAEQLFDQGTQSGEAKTFDDVLPEPPEGIVIHKKKYVVLNPPCKGQFSHLSGAIKAQSKARQEIIEAADYASSFFPKR